MGWFIFKLGKVVNQMSSESFPKLRFRFLKKQAYSNLLLKFHQSYPVPYRRLY